MGEHGLAWIQVTQVASSFRENTPNHAAGSAPFLNNRVTARYLNHYTQVASSGLAEMKPVFMASNYRLWRSFP